MGKFVGDVLAQVTRIDSVMFMLRALRADTGTCERAILMLATVDGVDSEPQAFTARADDYILKPVKPCQLAACTERLLGRSQARQLAGSQ
jgi:DNA-binding response OmpR family regulator